MFLKRLVSDGTVDIVLRLLPWIVQFVCLKSCTSLVSIDRAASYVSRRDMRILFESICIIDIPWYHLDTEVYQTRIL